MEEDEERIFTIPLRTTKSTPRTKRSPKAIKVIKEYVARHTKAEKVWIDERVNEVIWKRGIQHPPRTIRVKVVPVEEGEVSVELPDE